MWQPCLTLGPCGERSARFRLPRNHWWDRKAGFDPWGHGILQKGEKEPDHSPKCLSISIDVAVSFETPTCNELPLSISMCGILYNATQGTGHAFAKTIRLRMGVFSVAPHTAPSETDTAYRFFVRGMPIRPPWQKHRHTIAGLDRHKIAVVLGMAPAMRRMDDPVAADLPYCFPVPLAKHGVSDVIDGHF